MKRPSPQVSAPTQSSTKPALVRKRTRKRDPRNPHLYDVEQKEFVEITPSLLLPVCPVDGPMNDIDVSEHPPVASMAMVEKNRKKKLRPAKAVVRPACLSMVSEIVGTTISCNECKMDFIHSEIDRVKFEIKGFSPPIRCKSCRDARKKILKPEDNLYPVLKKHKNPNYEQVTYHIPVSNSMTQKIVDLISQFHPCKLDDLHVYYRDNKHPYCAALRSISEAWALNQVITELGNSVEGKANIMDVGGAASRHFSHGRDYVWSCIPPYDARDSLRQFRLPGNNNCTHEWQSCHCHADRGESIGASISVHSLYYIPPADILRMLLLQLLPVHYAVIHFYPDNPTGTIMNGEMEFRRDKGRIWVNATGNLTWYNHCDGDWMKTGHYADNQGTLEWEIDRVFDDVAVLRFVASRSHYPQPPVVPDHVNVVKGNEDPKALFKQIFNESMHWYENVTEKNLKLFLARVTRNAKAKLRDIDMGGLMSYASKEYNNQTTIIAPVPEQLVVVSKERAERLALYFRSMPTHVICALVATLVFSTILTAVSITGNVFEFPVISGQIPLFTAIGALFCLIPMLIYGLKPKWFSVKKQIKGFHEANLLELFRTQAMVYDYCCELPDKPLDKSKCTKFVYPESYGDDCVTKPAAKAMVYHPEYVPFFPRKCVHNQVTCLRNKLLHDIGPVGKYKFGLHPVLVATARRINGTYDPLTWEEWVSRFPPEKEARLRDEYNSKLAFFKIEWNRSKVFSKFEAYAEPKYPRPIISSDVEFNYSSGRWFIPIAERLAEELPTNVKFPLHGDSNDIGSFHEEHMENELYDSDFTSFDSSQREEALLLLLEFYRLCGMSEDAITRECHDVLGMLIETRSGLKATVHAIRCSGRSATLLGNSVLTINTSLHIHGNNLAALLVKGDDAVLYLKQLIDVDTYVKMYAANGFVVKLRNVDMYDVEFCSSIFLPCEEGLVLVPKPGKLLAKTFWCKHWHYTMAEVETQFAGILKGLSKACSITPGIRGLYNNPVYNSRHSVAVAHYDTYNEYASEKYTPNEDTLNFLCLRYGLTHADISELEDELAKDFPVKLSCFASHLMIEKDWGESMENPGFVEVTKSLPCFIISPLLEELCRWFFPFLFSLAAGIYESVHYGTPINFVVHMLLGLVSPWSPWMALLLHYGYNFLCCRRQNNILYIMSQRKKNRRQKRVVTMVVANPPRQRKRRSKKNKNNKRSQGPGIDTFALSRLNPFLPEICGVKVPDAFGYPTGTGLLRASQAVSAFGGFTAAVVSPRMTAYYNIPGGTGATLTWLGGSFGNPMPQGVSLQNLAVAYRVVSWGIRVTAEVALTAASGHVWFGIVPQMYTGTFPYAGWPTTEAQLAALPLAKKYSLVELCEKPIIVSGRQYDDGAFRFRSTVSVDEQKGGDSSVESMNGWSDVMFFGSGLPSTGIVMNIETIMHVEFIHNPSAAYGFIDTAPERLDDASLERASLVGQASPVAFIESAIENADAAVGAMQGIFAAAFKAKHLISAASWAVGKSWRAQHGGVGNRASAIEWK